MKKYLIALFSGLSYARNIFLLRTFRSDDFIRELESELKKHQLIISKGLVKRINQYSAATCLLSNWFASLRGKKLSTEEQKLALYFAALSPVVDDLMDNHHFDFRQLNDFVASETANDEKKILYAFLTKNIREKQKNNLADFENYLVKVVEAQNKSNRQSASGEKIPVEELKKITFDKGGYSVLFFRCIGENAMSAEEKDALYKFGSTLQLLDDLFDVYEDSTGGFQTMATNSSDIKSLRKEYESVLKEMIASFKNLPYEKRNIQKTLYQILFFKSTGFVAIDQLEKLQVKNSGIFSPENFSRKELVCDMQKARNVMSCLRYAGEWMGRV